MLRAQSVFVVQLITCFLSWKKGLWVDTPLGFITFINIFIILKEKKVKPGDWKEASTLKYV
jgi:hypothetical protein